jgi:uncharacterized protein
MRSQLCLRLSLALALGCSIGAAHAFDAPPNDGYITDVTGTLTSAQDEALETSLDAYRVQTSNQIAVLMVESLSGADLVQTAVDIGRKWGIGTKEKSNGVFMLIAKQDRELTIQVGYGLEGALPDIVTKGIIDTDVLPSFRDGKYFEGIQAGVAAIEKHIGGEYTADRYTASGTEGIFPFFLVFFFIVLNFLSAWLARSRSFWVGGAMGGVFVIDIFKEAIIKATLFDGMRDVLISLKEKGFKIGLLSNTTIFESVVLENLEIKNLFDAIVFSWHRGALKPSKEAFGHIFDELAVLASEVVFVDDTEKNIVAARKQGIPAIQFKSVPELSMRLRELGIL